MSRLPACSNSSSSAATSDALAVHWSSWAETPDATAATECPDLDLDALASALDPVASSELEASLARLDRATAASDSIESTLLLSRSGSPDSSSSSSGGGGSVDDVTSSAATSSQATDSNSSRRRVKQELEFLRARVAELQKTLGELQSARDAAAGRDAIAADETARAVTDPWEGIAAHQRAVRERSEQKNARLRASLQAQLQLAKSLERLLRKRPSLWTNDGLPSKRVSSFRSAGPSSSDDAVIFERLLASVEHAYASYRADLAQNGLLNAPCGHRSTTATPTSLSRSALDGCAASAAGADADARNGGGESVCVELVDVKRMPFEMRETSDAAWRIITTGHMQLQHEVYRGFEGASDTLAISYSLTLTRKRLSVDFATRAVMKRFVEDDRVVFVWESLADTDGSHCVSAGGKRMASGIQVHERGWTVFEREDQSVVADLSSFSHVNSVGGGAVDASSRIRTCIRMVPLVTSPTSSASNAEDASRQVGLLSSLSLEYFGPQVEQAQHAIETLLLDERTRQRTKLAREGSWSLGTSE